MINKRNKGTAHHVSSRDLHLFDLMAVAEEKMKKEERQKILKED